MGMIAAHIAQRVSMSCQFDNAFEPLRQADNLKAFISHTCVT